MTLANVILTVVLLSRSVTSTEEQLYSPSETYTSKIRKCIDSLTKAVDFYSNRHRHLTVDSLHGLAILRDSSGNLCNGNLLPTPITQHLCKLSMLVNTSFENMGDFVLSNKLGFLLNFDWSAKTFTGNTRYMPKISKSISSTQHEDCLLELNNRKKAECIISEGCTKLYFEGIGHETQLTRQSDCRPRNLSQMDVYQMSETLCFSVLSEFGLNYHRRNLSIHARILMLEQIVYCGLGGYFQMAHPKMMEEIISWQDPSGCFKAVLPAVEGEGDKEYENLEKPLKDGCLLHLTSMAASALMMHLYRFATEVTFVPDFHSILLMEAIFLDNAKKLPDFVVPRSALPLPAHREASPYATIPDTVL